MSDDDLLALASAGVKRARALGADAAEVYVRETRTTALIAHGEFVAPSETFTRGVGVRIMVDGRLGASGCDDSDEIDAIVARALASARALKGEPIPMRFPAPSTRPSDVRAHPALVEADAARVSALARATQTLLTESPNVTYAGTQVRVNYLRYAVANSEGVEASGETATERIELEARLTRGSKERSTRGSWTAPRPLHEDSDMERLACGVVDDGRRALDDAPLAGGPVMEAILAPPAASQVLSLFLAGLGSPASRSKGGAAGLSPGARVAPEAITIRDLPHGPVGRGFRAYDDEGVPTQETTLVERGVVEDHLYDAQAAFAAGRAPRGQGFRTSLSNVSAQAANPVLVAGDESLADIIAGAQRAVLITQPLLAAFVADATTGHFSLVAPFTYLVEGGRIRHALPHTSVAGNAKEVLASVRALGSDSRAMASFTGPSIRAGGITCTA